MALPASTSVALYWTVNQSLINQSVIKYDVHLARVAGEDLFLCIYNHSAITKEVLNNVVSLKNLEEFSIYTVTVTAHLRGNLMVSSWKNFTTLSAGRYMIFMIL